MKGRVLIIAGSDSGGGAGIQADIKAVTALRGFAMTAITALTAQNTLGVHGVSGVPIDFVRQQIAVVLDDLGADAVKTGMLHDVAVIEAVCDELAARARGVPLVVDPVMIAKGGHPLIAADAVATLKARLLPLATVITPNLPEAEALVGRPIRTLADMRAAAEALRGLGAPGVLLKGGHMDGAELTDLLVTADGTEEFTATRIETRHTHGTGCTLASAIATGLAQGMSLRDAVGRGRAYVLAAIAAAPGFGAGHGPLDHGITVDTDRIPR
ncbi:bifunctional hydroxymethylpyrimidine kinase/phosphomethylpyrimidine kinase [Roseomonas terrae]|jgi:hydroxymethylpyrimidine/phosphomethylpyrimidine kinase|uniref:hydroxymethylpyrimidine kinase n=1 Tax=Neoroseomonas terrae TaxID=424799 RepID=A0ABS5EGB8_9PROT|nr:bifunctional hydroxymethylpyrimidine kinase/phosphomethylpyrimidine kinase [Neoroseomonas terrae]MBR0650042.1 bifunctional hydroxymethylpyrimidine kinase/phosphomethylpyrimidine kinase [Neoroseomonas terrae]